MVLSPVRPMTRSSASHQARSDPVEDESIQQFPLLGGRQAGEADRARGPLRQPAGVARTVALQHLGRDGEVAGQLHVHSLGREMEEQGRIQLAALYRGSRALKQGAEVEAEHIDHLHSRIIGANGAQRFERSEEHTSELQSQFHLVCRLLLEKKKKKKKKNKK